MDNSILEDHQISLIYLLDEIDVTAVTSRTIAETMSGGIAPADVTAQFSRQHAAKKAWIDLARDNAGKPEASGGSASIDLVKPVRGLLSGNRPGLLRRFCLAPEIEQILRYGDLPSEYDVDLSKKMICLDLGPRARARVEALGVCPKPLWINLTQTELLHFGTGATIVTVNAELMRIKDPNAANLDHDLAPSLAEFQEAVHALARFNKCRWYDRETSEPLTEGHFSFGHLIHSLVRKDVPRSTHFTRVPTMAFARLPETTEPGVLEREAANLARRYTTDYPFSPENSDVSFLRDFDDMRHAITSEGFATVQCRREGHLETEFSQNWKTGPLAEAYLPIYMLLLHENWFLSERRDTAFEAANEDDLLHDLEQVVDDMALFQLYFRFPSFSLISMHQRAADAVRQALHLDEKLTFFQTVVLQISERLKAAYAAKEAEENLRRDEAFSWVARFGAAALAGLTAYTILKDLLLLVASSFDFSTLYPGTNPDQEVLVASWATFALSFLIALIAYYVAKQKTLLPKGTTRSARSVLLNRIAAHLQKSGR